MMFAPGDLVVCVDDSPCRCCGGPIMVKARAIYRVTDARSDVNKPTGIEVLALVLQGVRGTKNHPAWRGITAARFRKIDPLADLDTRAAGKTFRLPAKPVLDPAWHSRELAK